VIGAKKLHRAVVLGELLAQEIEAKTNLKVDRRFYLAAVTFASSDGGGAD